MPHCCIEEKKNENILQDCFSQNSILWMLKNTSCVLLEKESPLLSVRLL